MTFKELYFCNDRWSGDSLLTVDIIPADYNTPRQKHLAMTIYDVMRKYNDYAVETFKNDWVILREV